LAPRRAVRDGQGVAGKQLAHALEEGLPLQAELEGEVVLHPVEVDLDRGQEGEERLRLAGEVENARDLGVIERLDPEPIARAEEGLARLVPEREGEHPAQLRDAVFPPL